MKTAAIYARVSSQGDRQSTDRQVADLEVYATGNNIRILRTFTEKISGAVRNQARPILTECLEFCSQNHPDMLLVSELSRLGRDTTEILTAVRQLNESGVSLFIQNMGIQTLQEDGTPNYVASILIPLLSEVARIERQNIKERLNSGRIRFKEAGGQLGRPKGTGKTPEELIKEYPGIVRRLKKGQTISDIAKLEGKSESTVKKVKRNLVTIWPDAHGGKDDLVWQRLEGLLNPVDDKQ